MGTGAVPLGEEPQTPRPTAPLLRFSSPASAAFTPSPRTPHWVLFYYFISVQEDKTDMSCFPITGQCFFLDWVFRTVNGRLCFWFSLSFVTVALVTFK